MSEKTQEQTGDEPAPTQESDANRVTEGEAERASKESPESSEDESEAGQQ